MDVARCILSISRDLVGLGQSPLSRALLLACKAAAALRRDRLTEHTAHVWLQVRGGGIGPGGVGWVGEEEAQGEGCVFCVNVCVHYVYMSVLWVDQH